MQNVSKTFAKECTYLDENYKNIFKKIQKYFMEIKYFTLVLKPKMRNYMEGGRNQGAIESKLAGRKSRGILSAGLAVAKNR